VFTPKKNGWMNEVDRAIAVLKPDSWKGYTIGSPFSLSKWPWRLDDEKLVYPAYEKMQKAGITNVCIHKGLLPSGFKEQFSSTWQYAGVDDVGKAAKDWPGLNFMIYHSAIRQFGIPEEEDIRIFEEKGYIPWVSDLAQIPERFGVKNVYAELGSVFAITALSNPRYCTGILGTLIRGLGADKVLWGTDSVFYGSPQWQIEAFRRIEIPEDLRKKFGYEPLGPADGSVKTAILGKNAARLYRVKV
jgi:predicted TIM-barrel fold metal-dependent hydrolase